MAKVLCVLYDDPVDGYPPAYARNDIPKIERYPGHVLNPEGVSVYVPEGRDAESLPESIKSEIRRQLKGQS